MTNSGDFPGPPVTTDPCTPLTNLTTIRNRVDSLSRYLSNSVNSSTILPPHEMDSISSQLISAIHQIIINGASLLSFQSQPDPIPRPVNPDHEPTINDDIEIVEIDAVEILAEHIHICEVCGKGFKRDANLRMHMRAHGNQYKTVEALARPDNGSQTHLGSANINRETLFSCPYEGCNRNKRTANFRPLKSLICVKNHFKRSHCVKKFGCTRCNKKSFSLLADLKCHLKNCRVGKWKCCCGVSFDKKDELFGHMAMFDGHMPAIDAAVAAAEKGVVEEEDVVVVGGSSGGGVQLEFDDMFEGLEDGNLIIDDFFRF